MPPTSYKNNGFRTSPYWFLVLLIFLMPAVVLCTSQDDDLTQEPATKDNGLAIQFYPEKLSIFQFQFAEVSIYFEANSSYYNEMDEQDKQAWLRCPGQLAFESNTHMHLKVINGTAFNVTPDDFYRGENFTITVQANNLGYAHLVIVWTSLAPLDKCQEALLAMQTVPTQEPPGPLDITIRPLKSGIGEDIVPNMRGSGQGVQHPRILTPEEDVDEDTEVSTTTKKPKKKKKPHNKKRPLKKLKTTRPTNEDEDSGDDGLPSPVHAKRSVRKETETVAVVMYDFSRNATDYRYRVVIFRDTGTVDLLFVILVTCCVAINTLFMGCQVDLQVIISVLKKPIGPAVGFFSQFVFMPVSSYILSQLLFTETNYMLGLFALGCSPGGSGSNFWTLLLGGDLNLSVTMTFISTVCCIFMMPLWLFTLGQSILRRGRVTIPFRDLVFSLVAFIVPLGLGLLVQKLRPTWAKFAAKLVKPFTFFLLFAFNGLAIWNNMYVFRMITWHMIVGGLAVAWGGYFFGAFMAWLFRQGRAQIIAISIETAIQNPGVTFMVLRLTLPQPDADMSTVAPVAQIFVTNLPLLLIFFIYKIVTLVRSGCQCRKKDGDQAEKKKSPSGIEVELQVHEPLVGERISDQSNRDSRPPKLAALDNSYSLSQDNRMSEPRYMPLPKMYGVPEPPDNIPQTALHSHNNRYSDQAPHYINL